jgi:RNA polymerase sigma factor (sigma-70 family)
LLQECLTHWYYKKSGFNFSQKASIKTYCTTIIRNKLLDLVKSYSRDKRKISHYSIDESQQDRTALIDYSTAEKPSVDIDFSKVLQKLTSRQQKLCELLQEGLNITNTAKALGISRRNVYYELKRIRRVFEKEGLTKYY